MSKRILVVEDQPDNHQIIRDMLALPTMRSPRPRTVRRRSRYRETAARSLLRNRTVVRRMILSIPSPRERPHEPHRPPSHHRP
jgi:CheY-like chemotaxis protein